MIFDTGVIALGTHSEPREAVFIYTDVAVGRAFVYDGNPEMKDIPQGYDSFYIPSQPLDRNKDGEFSLEEYHQAASFDGRSPM